MTTKKFKDITAQKFNQLTAVKYHSSNNGAYWIFKCDCGNEKVLRSSVVTNGYVKSCGCKAADSRFTTKTVLEPGTNIGGIVVISFLEKVGHNKIYKCRCFCGNEFSASASNLTSGNTKSCGCLKAKIGKEIKTTHGKSRSKIYNVWMGMKRRCYDTTNPAYTNYGGRGITICERWHTFENFYSDMGDPAEGMTIDRIDNDKPYSPDNCRWATHKEQNSNYRRNRVIAIGGQEKTVTQWAELAGIPPDRIFGRLRLGWTGEKLLEK